jgi:hypothetical protein
MYYIKKWGLALGAVPLLTSIPAFAQSHQCTVPNTLTNGQVADATEVMDNFDAIAGCVDETRNSAVTHEGMPEPGEIAVFTSATGITSGDLSGDVTTHGDVVTTLSPTGVVADTYSNPILTIDAKGRILSAANGNSSGSGNSAWSLVFSSGSIVNPVPFFDVNVSGYSEVLIIGRAVSAVSPGYRGVLLSVDDGQTFYKSTGDYEAMAESGATSGNFMGGNQNAYTSAGRSFGGTIQAVSTAGIPKPMTSFTEDVEELFVGSYQPITHIRVSVLAQSDGPEISMNGGEVFVLGR